MHRLFIGVEMDERARFACEAVAVRLERAGLRARFIPPENYHLTLLFLGNVENEKVPSIESAARAAAAKHSAFTIALDRAGAFPHERKPSVVFVGSHGVDARYRALAKDVRAGYAALGYVCDDDAVPHVTIARVPEKNRRPMPRIEIEPIAVAIGSLRVFESVPHEGRTRYVVRSAFAFPDGASGA
jgi:2'-5' RNA ligase